MCTPTWDLVRLADAGRARLGARLADGRTVDLQAAHVARLGRESPHLRDATSFRLAGCYAADMAESLVRWATETPSSGVVRAA
ncbi:MAG TPA: hypothetical protein VHH36_06890 [Candidatus Thermoplasmatota archaeon]|nr:hypothetical protein [Candidatus Thermoplasmatota archaeon]